METITPEINRIAEIDTKTTMEEEETIATEEIAEIIGPITETAAGPEIETITEMTIGMTIEEITEGAITTKDIAIGTKITVGLGTEEIVVPGESSHSRNSSQNRYETRRQSKDNSRNRDRSEPRSRSSS